MLYWCAEVQENIVTALSVRLILPTQLLWRRQLTPTKPDRRAVFRRGEHVILGDVGVRGKERVVSNRADGSANKGFILKPTTNRQHQQLKINMEN